ncbi:MAG: 16S rRNA (uracil(1498)-N(3))-methyltransferase, partial [Verrucomicrobia bacterium]|nr:16S rRNA (uracil(1498)-N(3))-methyltransferase [Verrucomicrobiota bacterium]
GAGTAEVLDLDKHRAQLRPLIREQKPPPRPAVTLVQAVIREAHMDWVVQKAVELGASVIAPVWTTRGVVRAAASDNRKRRWEAIVLNAARQSRAVWLPVVEDPVPLPDFLARRPRYDLFLVAALDQATVPLRHALAVVEGAPESVAALVGPEGDFTADELCAAREAGALAVSLGARTLRAETAALYLLSVIRHVWAA